MKAKQIFSAFAAVCAGVLLLAGCGASASGPAASAAAPASTAAPASGAALEAQASPALQQQAVDSDEFIGEAAAKAIALNHAGLAESDVTFVHVQLDFDDGRWEYEVEFYSGNVEYDYDIDALTGEIRSYDQDAEHITGPAASGAYIGEAEAKRIALAAAGFAEGDVTALRVQFDIEDGRAEYEVEWYVGTTEYSYEIDAVDGSIIGYDVDRDG